MHDKGEVKPALSFSIENILKSEQGVNRFCHLSKDTPCENKEAGSIRNSHLKSPTISTLPWLAYTRYCPPRIPRTRNRRSANKRKVSSSPRVPFTTEQLKKLEKSYEEAHYVTSTKVTELSSTLKLPESRIKIWFQNRRSREKKKSRKPSSFQTKSQTSEKVEDHSELGELGKFGWCPRSFIGDNSTQSPPYFAPRHSNSSNYLYNHECDATFLAFHQTYHFDYTVCNELRFYL